MAGICISNDQCIQCGQCIQQCPFQALSMEKGKVMVNANCKVCRICIKTCPVEAIFIEEKKKETIDKSLYQNILVYVEHDGKTIHPVTFELIGKALQLAQTINQSVICLLVGYQVQTLARSLLYYGVNQVYVYDDIQLKHFRVDNYANAFEDCIHKIKPTVCLFGATTTGRSLAPRIATRFRTGLTADCTVLEMRSNTDLVQIRPAFGGNVMAQIINTDCRPQFATVRYKVMDSPLRLENPTGEIIACSLNEEQLKSKIEVIEVFAHTHEASISDAEIVVVAGAGIKDEKGMDLVKQLAALLGGVVAGTRPMVEKGMISIHQQIGLSGRTVKPKLMITCGVSGAIQFTAGMNGSDKIFAINQDPDAPIFKLAHYAVVDDVYQLLPQLIEQMKKGNTYEL